MRRQERQADVIFGERRLRGARGREIVEFRALHLRLEARFRMQPVEQHGHPPGEALGLPYARERGIAIGAERRVVLLRVVGRQRAAQIVHVRGREIEALGAGRRHDVGGVSGEEQPAMLHGRSHEAAQRRDALLDRRTRRDARRGLRPQPTLELVPYPLIRPFPDLLVEAALDVVAAAGGRPHRGQGKAARVAGVDELIRAGRHIGQDTQPAERVGSLERLARWRQA